MRRVVGAAILAAGIIAAAALATLAVDDTAQTEPPRYASTIRWTSYGIPHIEASDWGGLGYGYGYAAAKDYLCVIAEEYVTTNGERSKFFGASERYALSSNGQSYSNLESDLFFTLLKENPDLVTSIADHPRSEIQAALDGYVAGYNRYLADTPEAQRPVECRDESWVRPITRDDMAQRANKLNLIASMGFFAPYMVKATPPTPGTGATPAEGGAPTADVARTLAQQLPTPENLGIGSNGYAFGSEMTANGRGMLLGNPHFPWAGPERFHQLHLTIPGEVDVMGATLLGVPLVLIGFNDAVAWTHTVSTGWRFSLHELTLVPGDPTSYVVDGAIERMTSRGVTIDAGDAGDVSHTFWFSRYGPVIDFPAVADGQGLTWEPNRAYAINDANARNGRTVEQFYRWNTAQSFDRFVADLKVVHGVPWVNTIAVSPDGRALYADVSVVPNFDAMKIERCNTPVGRALFAAARLPVFDGSRSDCGPTDNPNAAQPGIIPADAMPLIITRDWLINSNDDYWLPNPAHPIEGDYSPMIGPGPSERSARTRMGYLLALEHEPRSLTLPRLQESLFTSRLYIAETELDQVLAGACALPALGMATSGAPVDLTEACDVLGAWDRRANVESAGLPLFELFWQHAPKTWGVPFDANDPVNTPHGFVSVDPRVRAALADTILLMRDADIPLGATTGEARAVERGGTRIGLHGAAGALGSPSMLVVPFEPGVGFLEPIHGNSYLQTVTWDDAGAPLAAVLLSYSQSPHADSPHHADQTRLYAQKQWVRAPFSLADIEADPNLETLRLVSG